MGAGVACVAAAPLKPSSRTLEPLPPESDGDSMDFPKNKEFPPPPLSSGLVSRFTWFLVSMNPTTCAAVTGRVPDVGREQVLIPLPVRLLLNTCQRSIYRHALPSSWDSWRASLTTTAGKPEAGQRRSQSGTDGNAMCGV